MPPEPLNISTHISQEVSNINRSSAPATTTENNQKRCFDSLQRDEKVDNISRALGDTSLASAAIQSVIDTGSQSLRSTTSASIDPVESRPIAPLRRTRRFVRLSAYAVSSHQPAVPGHPAAAVGANHGIGLVAAYPLAVESKPAVKALQELEYRLQQMSIGCSNLSAKCSSMKRACGNMMRECARALMSYGLRCGK
jgi:hypothetical protein